MSLTVMTGLVLGKKAIQSFVRVKGPDQGALRAVQSVSVNLTNIKEGLSLHHNYFTTTCMCEVSRAYLCPLGKLLGETSQGLVC